MDPRASETLRIAGSQHNDYTLRLKTRSRLDTGRPKQLPPVVWDGD